MKPLYCRPGIRKKMCHPIKWYTLASLNAPRLLRSRVNTFFFFCRPVKNFTRAILSKSHVSIYLDVFLSGYSAQLSKTCEETVKLLTQSVAENYSFFFLFSYRC